MKYHLVFDPDRCCACHACSVACMDQNNTDVDAGELPLRMVFNEELSQEGELECAYLSTACAHCEDAPCIMACPVGCLKKDPDTGMTIYDNDNCIGCRSCGMACPFGAPRYLPDNGKMIKCDGCNERLKAGLEPACVRACTFGALQCLSEKEYQGAVQAKALRAILVAAGNNTAKGSNPY